MKAIVIKPGVIGYEVKDFAGDAYDAVKKELDGGWLECLPLAADCHAWIDEEGKLKHLEVNVLGHHIVTTFRRLLPGDFIVGPVVIVGTVEGPDGLDDGDVPENMVTVVESIKDAILSNTAHKRN